MKLVSLSILIPAALVIGLAGCEQRSSPGTTSSAGSTSNSKTGSGENIDDDERAAAAKLKIADDPVLNEIEAFRNSTLTTFQEGKFDELESLATELRTSKEVFGNGSWKLYQFYDALTPPDDASTLGWSQTKKRHQKWISEKPDSPTAHLAQARFLVNFAWNARGSGLAKTVTKPQWALFHERLAAASEALSAGGEKATQDPLWHDTGITIMMGQSADPNALKALAEEGHKVEPKFWATDVSVAYALTPRWLGEKGDWEKFAAEAANRPDGLGDEVYARIVLSLVGHYGNVFRETKASWPRTKAGLELIRKRYPNSQEPINMTALAATMGFERPLAKEMFDKLGDTYLPAYWSSRERFAHFRHWAETGNW